MSVEKTHGSFEHKDKNFWVLSLLLCQPRLLIHLVITPIYPVNKCLRVMGQILPIDFILVLTATHSATGEMENPERINHRKTRSHKIKFQTLIWLIPKA